MAGIKISDLPSVSSPNNSDIFPIVQSGTTYKESCSQLITLLSSAFQSVNDNLIAISSGYSPFIKNIIIGGDFWTNPWQRGELLTGLTGSGSNYLADRFKYVYSGSAVATISKDGDYPPVLSTRVFSTACYTVQTTTDSPLIGASDLYAIQYGVEGKDFSRIALNDFVLSFWVLATNPGTYTIGFQNIDSNISFVREYTITNSAEWEYITINVSPNPEVGSWDYTNGLGLLISFNIAIGSDYQTTEGSWQNGNFLSTINQINGMDAINNVFKIDLIQLEGGIYPTPFEKRSFEQEVQLCQRYYEKTFDLQYEPASGSGLSQGCLSTRGIVAGGFDSSVNWLYKTRKREVPTITTYNPGLPNSNWYNSSTSLDSGTPLAMNSGQNGVTLNNSGAATDSVNDLLIIHATADADF